MSKKITEINYIYEQISSTEDKYWMVSGAIKTLIRLKQKLIFIMHDLIESESVMPTYLSFIGPLKSGSKWRAFPSEREEHFSTNYRKYTSKLWKQWINCFTGFLLISQANTGQLHELVAEVLLCLIKSKLIDRLMLLFHWWKATSDSSHLFIIREAMWSGAKSMQKNSWTFLVGCLNH
jgi:hypothetical protein